MAGKMKQYITNSDIYSTEEKNKPRQSRNTTFFLRKDNAHSNHKRPLSPNYCQTQANCKDRSHCSDSCTVRSLISPGMNISQSLSHSACVQQLVNFFPDTSSCISCHNMQSSFVLPMCTSRTSLAPTLQNQQFQQLMTTALQNHKTF